MPSVAAAPCCPGAGDVGGGATPAASSSAAARANPIVWRIHAESSKVLEMVEMSGEQDVHRRGLHLAFEDNLSSFASVIPSQIAGKSRYIVWVLTAGGVVYRIQVSGAASGWMLCGNQQHDVSADVQRMHEVTAFAAAPEVLCLGGRTGSITCVPFGIGSPEAEDPFELKDADPGIRGLWGFVSRGKSAGSVRSLVTRQLNGSFVLFALHEDGTLRLWDLLHRHRVLNHPLSSERELEDFEPKLMWVEEVIADVTFQIALLCNSSDSSRETIVVCSVTVGPGDGMAVRQGYVTVQHMVSLPEGKVLDLKLLETGVWILQSTTKSYELLFADFNKEGSLQVCQMQEKGVAEQLMQVPGDKWADFLYIIHPTIGVSAKLTLSDVFLRRMLQPGVRQQKALQEALEHHGRPISDSDIASLSLDALRNYILSAVESESCGDSRAQVLHGWMSFSSEYMKAWTRNSKPYSLVADANNNSIGLIRRSSVATVRSLTDVEQFSPGGGHIRNRAILPDEWKNLNRNEQNVLVELISCAKHVVDHLGRVAMGVLYESLLRPVDHPVPALLASIARILDVGFNSSRVAEETGHIGVDDIRNKEQEQHRKERTFALHVAQALQALQSKAGGWSNLFQIISKYTGFLVLQLQPMGSATGSTRKSDCSLLKKLLSQSTSQISWAHFKAARDLLLLLVYCVKIGIQVGLTSSQISYLKSHFIPEIQEVMTASLLVHWLTVTFAEVPPPEDFSSQLSSLRLDGTSSRVGSGRMGSGDLTLGELLVSAFLDSSNSGSSLPEGALPRQDNLLAHSWQFVNWLLLGETGNSSQQFSKRAISLSNILLQYGQYSSLERFLTTVEQFSSQQKFVEGIRSADGLWSARLHLLGFCLLARARTGLKSIGKENQVGEAIRCFFRAASGLGEASEDLRSLFVGTGYQQIIPERGAAAAWRLYYYEWVMQIFEQYNLSEGACQFAHAALEQVDEATRNQALDNSENPSPTTLVAAIKGRLWANVFKFSLDLDLYGDAYCAIISNPDEESKFICLRRFIVVLCERKVTQVLCAQEFPYAGLLEKVDQELLWKAENSDISAKPSPYKLLYGLHMQRHNWRRAAACMYRYTVRVREESRTPNIQEELHGILAAINALQLVDPTYAWFELPSRAGENPAPSKRQRLIAAQPVQLISITEKREKKTSRAIDLEDLEKDYALTKARMQLAHSEVKHLVIGGNATPEEVVWSLIQCRLYETAFSVLFLFWKDSLLKRELEKIMDVMARNCCLLQIQEATPSSLLTRGEPTSRLLLTSGTLLEDAEEINDKGGEDETGPKLPPAGTARTAWQALQQYLEKYRSLHPRLPVIVAESILNVDRHMELPLWLVNIFKGGKDAGAAGMAGLGADPAALLRIYLDFDRLAEATALVLEYIRAWSTLKPADVIKRKLMCAVWFPYTLLDRLQSCLSKSSDMALRDKLQGSLKCALQNHFKQVKVDSDDVKTSL